MNEPTHQLDLVCHRCGALLERGRGSFYVVRIESFADPSPPQIDDGESFKSMEAEYEDLIDQMKDMSEQELMDQVHRRLLLHLCTPCYRNWIENPAA